MIGRKKLCASENLFQKVQVCRNSQISKFSHITKFIHGVLLFLAALQIWFKQKP